MECIKFIAVWVWLFTTLYYTKGKPGGSVLVRLDYLHNPDNTNYVGKCCGKRSLVSKCHPCDYQLSIWVKCDSKTTDSDCLYGMGKTRIFYNKSVISFPQDLGNGSRNPLVYSFPSFQGNLGISILATNRNGSRIHSYQLHKPIYPTSYGKKRWTNATLRANGRSNSNITLSYQVYCKEHYYSPSCSVGCLPGANYKCDESTGNKLCLNGYIGPNCTCKPGHIYNCDATGKRLCYPPWHGVKCDVKCQGKNDRLSGYNCNITTGAKICLIGWYGPDCNETTKTVSSTILANNSQETISTTQRKSNTLNLLTTKNNIHHITSMPRKMMSLPKITFTTLMTSSLQTSSLMTSPLMAPPYITSTLVTSSSMTPSPITSLMMSSTMTSTLMTSSPTTSHLFPSHVFSTLTEGGTTRPERTSMTIRNLTLVTSASMTPSPITSLMTSSTMTSTLMTSSPTTSHLFPSHVFSTLTEGGTTRPERTSMTIRNFTRQTESPKTSVTTSYLVKLKPLSSHIDFTEMTKNKLSGTSVDLTATSEGIKDQTGIIANRTIATSTPTPRDTTFRPGSTDARKGNNLWWLMLVPFIVAIVLIVTGIAVFKKKNRLRREISPHYEASMQELKVKAEHNKTSDETEHDQQDPKSENNNKESCQEDLEAIWKVMSTFHE